MLVLHMDEQMLLLIGRVLQTRKTSHFCVRIKKSLGVGPRISPQSAGAETLHEKQVKSISRLKCLSRVPVRILDKNDMNT